MYKEKWKNYFFPSKDQPLPDKYTLWRKFAQGLSSQARLRLEWIIFYQTIGKRNATLTALHFGISRKTFHKWYGRFMKSQGDVDVLRDLSKAPHRPREWEVTKEQQARVIHLRKEHLHYGKTKLKILYQEKYREDISTWKIERVIRRYSLYPDRAAHQQYLRRIRRRKRKKRTLITNFSSPDQFNLLWHIDSIIISWYGLRKTIITAIENVTKIAYARVYSTHSSTNAQDFLRRLVYLTKEEIKIVHSDNGTEFAGYFEKACQDLNITQIYSRVRQPKDNASLERFNRTLQEEWLSQSKIGLDNISKANLDLTKWLIEYNAHRPHQALDYQTPLGYAQERFFKVLPMWSASTAYAKVTIHFRH